MFSKRRISGVTRYLMARTPPANYLTLVVVSPSPRATRLGAMR